MKTLWSISLVSAILILVPAAAGAQVTIDVTPAYTVPTGDFSDSSKPGFGIAGEVFLGLPLFPVEVGGRAAYNHFGAGEDFESGHTNIIEILPSIRYVIAPPLSPVKVFVQVGAGLYKWSNEFDVKGIPVAAKDDGTDFGVSVGAGVRAKLGPLTGITAMPMYHIIMTEDENTTYLSLNVGLVF